MLLEQEYLNVNLQMLKDISATTGGEYFDEYGFSLEKIYGKLKKVERKTEIEKTSAGSTLPWFVLIAGLLALEWYLRKRKGLW